MSAEPAQIANKAEVWSAWAANHSQNNLEIFESYGIGLKAPKSFQEGDVLLKVPAALAITTETPVDKDWLQKCQAQGPHLLHRIVVYLALQKSSPWTPYFKLLPSPEQLSLPFTWSLEEIDGLKGTSIGDATFTKRRFVDAALRSSQHLDGITPALWHLAYEWIASRALTHPHTGEHVLVPILDLVNHSCKANARYDCDGRDFILFATESIEKGQGVFIDYGVRSSGEFLFKYGFVPSEPDDHLTRTYDPMDEDIRKILDVSRDPEIPDEETKQMLEAAYNILTQFVGQAVFEVDGTQWSDNLAVLVACEDLVELKCVDGVYDLYIGDLAIDPTKIQSLRTAHPDVGKRANDLAKQLAAHFSSLLPKDSDAKARSLVEHEKDVYSRI